MKETAKKILPRVVYDYLRRVVRFSRTLDSFIYDAKRYYKYSVDLDIESESKLYSYIMLDTHVIEKGLTMPDMRMGFGQPRILEILRKLNIYVKNGYPIDSQILHAYSVLKEYFERHEESGFKLSDSVVVGYKIALEILKSVNMLQAVHYSNQEMDISSDNYFRFSTSNFREFSNSRKSIRCFSAACVDKSVIYDALDIARNTPSACNRQSVRVHVYLDRNEINSILEAQGGSRGFGHTVGCLIVVTYDQSCYFEGIERNTGLVDGGMYCMNILYALHYKKLAACALNTSVDSNKDTLLRRLTGIPDEENFVAMIGCGIASDRINIATSMRKEVNEVVEFH